MVAKGLEISIWDFWNKVRGANYWQNICKILAKYWQNIGTFL